MHALPTLYIHPGELVVTRASCQLVTVLGSCVAATLLHRPTGTAAICHVMLPQPPSNRAIAPMDPCRFRFASLAIAELVDRFRAFSIRPADVETRLFGGSARPEAGPASDSYAVGQKNLDAVIDLLDRGGFAIRSADTGSSSCRRVYFRTDTGGIVCEHLPIAPSMFKPCSNTATRP